MARVLSSAAITKIAEQFGTEPLNIIEITWLDGTLVRYGDKTIPDFCLGKILSIADIDEVVKVDMASSNAQVTVTLDDSDGTIKELLNKYDPHKRPVKMLQYYDANTFTTGDAFSLFEGEIVSPIVWDEHERTVTLTILSRLYATEAGFSPEEGQFSDVSNELIGNAWPMCFGTPIHVPAVKASQTLSGNAMTLFGTPDYSLPHKRKYMLNVQADVNAAYQYYYKVITQTVYKKFYIVLSKDPKATGDSLDGSFKIRINGKLIGNSIALNSLPNGSEDFLETVLSTVFTPKQRAILKKKYQFGLSQDFNLTAEDSATKKYFAYEWDSLDYVTPITIESESSTNWFVTIASIYDPRPLQYKYATTIVRQDKIKQAREDTYHQIEGFNKQIDSLYRKFEEEYDGVEDTDPDRAAEISRIEEFEAIRDSYSELLESYDATLEDIDRDFNTIETLKEDLKTFSSFVGDTREKMEALRLQHLSIGKEINNLDQLQKDEQTITKRYITVSGGERFPQYDANNPKDIYISVNGVVYSGKMRGRVFEIVAVEPRHKNIKLDERNELQDDDYKYIWLKDTNLNLEGHYLYCKDENNKYFVTKVATQVNNKCTLDLQEIPELSRRHQSKLYKASPAVLRKLRQAFADVLVGNESDEQIYAIASLMPQDICNEVKAILYGEPQTTYIISKIGPFSAGGFFTLLYDGFETPPIPVTADDELIEKALHTLPNIFAKKEDCIVKNMQVTFKDSLLPLKPLRANFSETLKAKVVQRLMVQNTIGGTFKFEAEIKGKSVRSKTIDAKISDITKERIKDVLKDMGYTRIDVIESTPTKLSNADVRVPVNENVKVFDIDWSAYYTKPTVDTAVKIVENKATGPAKLISLGRLRVTQVGQVAVYLKPGTGAAEYTVKQIENKVKATGSFDTHKKEYEDLRKRMGFLFNTLKFEPMEPSEKLQVSTQLAKDITSYVDLTARLNSASNAVEESKRLISDKEYKELMELEVLSFVELLRGFQTYETKIVDPVTKYYHTGRDIVEIVAASKHPIEAWFNGMTNLTPGDLYDAINSLPETEAAIGQIGDLVVYESDYQEKYVCNIIPSTIHAVYGTRTIDGVERLLPIPSRYYTKNENDSYGRYTCTTLSFKRPLADYKTDNWGSTIYVTLTSAVGPDMSDIVAWIATTYTDLIPDVDNFAAIKTKLANYPCNFAVFDKQDALSLIEDICWQSRCRSYFIGKALFIQYLSEKTDPVKTLTKADIENKTLKITYSETEEVVTKFIALWQDNYFYTTKKNKLILRHNINKYGEQAREFNFTIYNNRDLVLKSATFWLIRKANTWKKIDFSTMLHNLDLQTFDTITFDPTNLYVANAAIDCIIEGCTYNSDSLTIQLTLWCPVRAGEMEEYKFAWPSGVDVTDIYPTVQEVLDGNAGGYTNTRVPNDVEFDPTVVSAEFRPKDYGNPRPSDLNDSAPANPATNFEEFDYEYYEKLKFEIPEYVNKPVGNAKTVPDGSGPITPTYASNTSTRSKTREPLGPFIGRVIKSAGSGQTGGDKIPGGTLDPTVITVESRYKVQAPSGRVVEVRQVVATRDDILPNGYPVYVLYDEGSGEYHMQPPTWVSNPLRTEIT